MHVTESSLPQVSIIVPVYNGGKTLEKLLLSLTSQTYPQRQTEIILVNNNSKDESLEIIKKFSVVKLAQENIQNAGAARNTGIYISTGEILAFTDADCLPQQDWISRGVEQMLHSGVERVAGQVCFSSLSSESPAYEILDAVCNLNQSHIVQKFASAVTANLFVRRDTFSKVGLFPSENRLEDMQWNRQASLHDISLKYAADVIVYHPPRNSLVSLFTKSYLDGQGVFKLCQTENRGGWQGSRHWLRILRILIVPRSLHWDRLSFSYHKISLMKRIHIHLLKWILFNLAEALGYSQSLIQDKLQKG